MQNNNLKQRKKLFIDYQYQGRFILKFSFLVFFTALLSTAAVIAYVYSTQTVTTVFTNSRLAIVSTADFILPCVIFSGIVSFVFTGIATLFTALYTSHRIVGPAYRITKDLEEIYLGNLKKVILVRDKDELGALANSLNLFVCKIKDDISLVKNELNNLTNNSAFSDDNSGEKIKEIKNILEKYNA
jgi:methyl-accepting chemotaxis protein